MALLLRLLKKTVKRKLYFQRNKSNAFNIDETNLSLDGSDGGRGGV